MSEGASQIPDQPNPLRTLRDAVRLRPSMYFGTLDSRALHQLICCAIDHAVDESSKGTCNQIKIVLQDENVVSIQDNGSGIPIENDPETGLPLYQISPIAKPGKFNYPKYSFCASFHSLGLSVINAVCSSFKIETKRHGFLWQQQFEEGQPLSPLSQIRPLSEGETNGTEITFIPDYSIFESGEFDYVHLSRRLSELAYLLPGLTITLEDRRPSAYRGVTEFFSKDGVRDFVQYLNRDYEGIHEPIVIRKTIELEHNFKPIGFSGTFDIALQYTYTHQPIILSFVNGREVEGGPHLKGLNAALMRAVVHPARDLVLKQDIGSYGFTEDDYLCGLTAVINMQHPQPQSLNSLYFILANPELEDAVSELVRNAIEEFSKMQPNQMQRILENCLANRNRRDQRRYGKL